MRHNLKDTMMECTDDGDSSNDFIDLANDTSLSTPTIRDAAERLLTLLGVENNEYEDDPTSSEDEGVELDEASGDEDEINGETNTKFLHQLAASLIREFKYSQKSSPSSSSSSSLSSSSSTSSSLLPRTRVNREETTPRWQCIDDRIQRMEIATSHDQLCLRNETIKNSKYRERVNERSLPYKRSGNCHHRGAMRNDFAYTGKFCNEIRLKNMDEDARRQDQDKIPPVPPSSSSLSSSSINNGQIAITDNWTIGWDACATETIRYLVEDEGLPSRHPTVLAMKTHLETQRERALARYAS